MVAARQGCGVPALREKLDAGVSVRTIAAVYSLHRFGGAPCAVPGCKEWPVEIHHITYKPSKTAPLCRIHHEEITRINGEQARGPLSNRQRLSIWRKFLRGELDKAQRRFIR